MVPEFNSLYFIMVRQFKGGIWQTWMSYAWKWFHCYLPNNTSK